MIKASYLPGKRFAFTGCFDGLSRSLAEGWVEELGGCVISSVCTELDYLVCGDAPGTKLERALSLGITVLDREAFLRMVGRNETNIQPFSERGAEAAWSFDIMLAEAARSKDDEPEPPLQVNEIPGIAGKHFTFSGLLRGIKRETAERLVLQAGGVVEYTVTKSRTDFVVTDYAGGSEVDKAPKWGKPIIGGRELLEMLTGKP